jgi:ketosteroid isomerase-like protein
MLRPLLLLWALALTLVASATAAAADADSASSSSTAQFAIREVMLRQQADWNIGNIPGFMSGYLKSDALRFASGGTITQGWAETLARYQQHYDSPEKMGRLKFDIVSIDVLAPAAAVVFGRWELTLVSDEIKPNGLFTLVFRLTADGWRIVHDHTSSADT